MALEEYRRKRDFKKTPEPPPARPARHRGALSYLIQKHDATRLHYDFRLELDGVLLSWAVTKGPSLDPSDKRLAVRTEDHPLSYGSFEGTIPKGEYGGGTVMLWDVGTWEPKGDPHAGLKKGHLALTLHGKRLKGGWNLIRMRSEEKRENWLLIKEDDKEASRDDSVLEASSTSAVSGRTLDEIAGGTPPAKPGAELKRLMDRYPAVQLATLVDSAPVGEQWLHEIKCDGYRLLGFLSAGTVRLRTRNGKDWTARFPAIARALGALKAKSAVMDMEAVVLDDKGRSRFQALQAALGEGGEPSEIVAFVFDLLHLDGKDLTELPLSSRKEKLSVLLKGLKGARRTGVLRYSDHVTDKGTSLYIRACKTGLEGIVSKLADAPYAAGRQKTWLKSKCGQRQEFIILGYSAARKGGRALGALYLGYRKDRALRYAGKVGTGFSMAGARGLVKRFDPLLVPHPQLQRTDAAVLPAAEWKSIRWVKPELLCEVAFTEWTQDGRIRHPSFQGLREDKAGADVKKEMPVKVLAPAGVTITHPDRVISEAGHITKGQLAEYYAEVARLLLPGIVRRPLSVLRCPSGIGQDCFYQRSPGKGLGPDVQTFHFRHKGKKYEYLYIENEKGLLELVQMSSIEFSPWGASIDSIEFPDRLIFDLDPSPEVPFEAVKPAAQDLRQRLTRKGLDSRLKCTGGKGLHVTVLLKGEQPWSTVKSFAADLADEMVGAAPSAYVATMSKAKRTGKIFIDYFRNDVTATAIADYSVRARPGCAVAVPLEWSELKTLKSADQFTMKAVLNRIGKHKTDLASSQKPQTLPV